MRVELLITCVVLAGACAPSEAAPTKQSAAPRGPHLTVWNAKVPNARGDYVKASMLGGNPDVVVPASRVAAGIWQLAKRGETATHFTGTLQMPSFNHRRPATRKLQIKLRKTRAVMGVPRDYRPALHAILRGSGQLFVREVKDGEWEVVGYSEQRLGDVFAKYARWRADDNDLPDAAAPSPIVDPQADSAALATLINDYRASIKLPRVPISPALTKVARAHVRDLNANNLVSDQCNLHSWSKQRTWTGCCYDKSKAAARCMWAKPKEIAGYPGHGYEIAATGAGIEPALALYQWQQSAAHHEVMINQGIWKKPWAALGVAVEGDYAVAWFGEEPDKQ